MTFQEARISRPVLTFVLAIAGVLITGLSWATVAMGTGWASSVTVQMTQNTKDIAALREEYRVINTKLDSMTELLKQHMADKR